MPVYAEASLSDKGSQATLGVAAQASGVSLPKQAQASATNLFSCCHSSGQVPPCPINRAPSTSWCCRQPPQLLPLPLPLPLPLLPLPLPLSLPLLIAALSVAAAPATTVNAAAPATTATAAAAVVERCACGCLGQVHPETTNLVPVCNCVCLGGGGLPCWGGTANQAACGQSAE